MPLCRVPGPVVDSLSLHVLGTLPWKGGTGTKGWEDGPSPRCGSIVREEHGPFPRQRPMAAGEHKPIPEDEPIPDAIPITVITGFLGAGKSTLLSHILEHSRGQRIAVVQNELGNPAIQAEAITTQAPDGSRFDEWVELPNGCVCCTVRGQLATALEELVARRAGALDHVLIETTGVADPGVLAESLWLDDALESSLRMDGIVTVVDCARALRLFEEEPVAERQVAVADRILVNKVDLQSESEVAAVEARLRQLNPAAPVVRTTRARVDLDAVLGAGAFDAARVADVHRQMVTCEPCDSTEAVTLRIDGCVDLEGFKRWLCDLLWEAEDDVRIYRAKGVVCDPGGEAHVLQAVGDTWDLSKTGLEWRQLMDQPASHLVVIGQNLSRAALEDSLWSVHAGPEEHSIGTVAQSIR